MSMKVTFDVEETRLFRKALIWLLWKDDIDLTRRQQNRKKGGRRRE